MDTADNSPVKSSESPSKLFDNNKVSITCSNVPEDLFDATAAKKHFSKFGRVHKIRLLPKRQMCIIEYENQSSVEKALLNAGAYDGFFFEVTRTKSRIRRKSKKDDDPDWLPDSDVEEELSAMSGNPIYRVPRQKPMEIETPNKLSRQIRPTVQRKRVEIPVRPKSTVQSQVTSVIEPPVIVTTQTGLSTAEAATELHQLRSKISLTPDEKWRILDSRDRILRSWGGAGSRVKVGGATIGTCPDMCPEKELLQRQSEHQVMTLETIMDSDGILEMWRAVKQYSRSSADQEIPMCYELRPPHVLMRTCSYLLHEIADTNRQVALADWFHFMWDRLRGIRKDITQQALCCAESIQLMEMCARFHAHCAARLADLEHTQFDQKLNTDNLTKCLQTLKHMYTDVTEEQKPNEAEFRGYIALLNLGDANFWWEIKQLPLEIQKSEPIILAMKVFSALDNNNYVRFFRLVRDEATYLQACILLRYFNDVRARALARIVKAYAPRGGSKYPAEDLISSLAFESLESMNAFISHYGLRFSKVDTEICVILDRNQFIEDSDPYPIARSMELIESKRDTNVAGVISGGNLPNYDYKNHVLYTSFNIDGRLKDTALIAEDIGYNTLNDSNKDIKALKNELNKLSNGGKSVVSSEIIPESRESVPISVKTSPFLQKQVKPILPKQTNLFTPPSKRNGDKSFSFQPATPIDVPEIIKISPEKVIADDTKNLFTFSKPQDTADVNLKFDASSKNMFSSIVSNSSDLFKTVKRDNEMGKNTQSLFKINDQNSVFSKLPTGSIFASTLPKSNEDIVPVKNIFASANTNIFLQNDEKKQNVFGAFEKPFQGGVSGNKLSPGTLFKQANEPFSTDNKAYSIFHSKNNMPESNDAISTITDLQENNVYDFDNNELGKNAQDELKLNEEKRIMEEMLKEKERIKKEEELKEIQRKQDELRRQEEARRKEEIKQQEEIRKKEQEKKEQDRKRKIEEQRQAELKIIAEEKAKTFKEKVENESQELIEELTDEVNKETVELVMKEEMIKLQNLILYAKKVSDEILNEFVEEVTSNELKAEIFWTKCLMKKWFYVWRKQIIRNFKRRRLLEDTPIWLSDKTPLEEAKYLRRLTENTALKHMNSIHRGYKFKGQLNQISPPERYNIMDIIRSSLLKRMKQINYPYDKCFFWKVALISPGSKTWLYKKINIERWILDAFSGQFSMSVNGIIHLEKQSWNNLIDFATSVALINKENLPNFEEVLEGSNGLIFYMCHDTDYNTEALEVVLKNMYVYHVVPIAVITTKINNTIFQNDLQLTLGKYLEDKIISDFRIYTVSPENVADSLSSLTKSALKWLAKRYPQPPPLEIDSVKSICERYLGNELWFRLKSENDLRIKDIVKDLGKLVNFYNISVDKLVHIISDENLFCYPSFPLEFLKYLDKNSPYPKPYEFIRSNIRNGANLSSIKVIIEQLKLQVPGSLPQAITDINVQDQVHQYCNEIGWFKDFDTVCKVVALIPKDLSDTTLSCDNFVKKLNQFKPLDILKLIVYEKINSIKYFDTYFAMYDKRALEEYRNMDWLYDVKIIADMKHKVIEYDDDIDYCIEAKRRKINNELEYSVLEDKDCTILESTIKSVNMNIEKCNKCTKAVTELEKQLEEEKKKSEELEKLLQMVLNE